MAWIATFYGIAVDMYYNDHDPAHFHALYGSHRAVVSVRTLEILRGSLARRAWALVSEWAGMHESALQANWDRARTYEPLQPVAPLE